MNYKLLRLYIGYCACFNFNPSWKGLRLWKETHKGWLVA